MLLRFEVLEVRRMRRVRAFDVESLRCSCEISEETELQTFFYQFCQVFFQNVISHCLGLFVIIKPYLRACVLCGFMVESAC